MPASRDTLQLRLAPIREPIAGVGHSGPERLRDEDLAGVGETGDASSDVNRQSRAFVVGEPTVPHVHPDADLEAKRLDRGSDARSGFQCLCGVAEDYEESVAAGVHLLPAAAGDLGANGRMMTLQEFGPRAVSQLDRLFGRADDVREQARRSVHTHSVGEETPMRIGSEYGRRRASYVKTVCPTSRSGREFDGIRPRD